MWTKELSFSVLILLCVSFVQTSREVPAVIKTCDRDDIDLDGCLKVNIQSALNAFANGLPELQMPPTDPFHMKELTVEYKKNQISGKALLENIKATGLGKFKVLAVRSNIQDDSLEMEVDLTLKKLVIEGHLKGEGRLNLLVFKAKGQVFNNTMRDIDFTWRIAGKTELKNGEPYLKLTHFKTAPEVGDMTVHIPEVTDSPELNRLAYYFVNTFWRTIYRELLPIVETSWEKIFMNISNKIFSKIPYNKLFPTTE